MEIVLGAMSDPISKQIADAGFVQTGKSVEVLDRIADALVLAWLHGCLSDSEYRRGQKRLIKQIKVRPRPANPKHGEEE